MKLGNPCSKKINKSQKVKHVHLTFRHLLALYEDENLALENSNPSKRPTYVLKHQVHLFYLFINFISCLLELPRFILFLAVESRDATSHKLNHILLDNCKLIP